MASRRRTIAALIISAAAGLTAYFLVPEPLPELSRPELIAEVQAGYVDEVVVIDQEVIHAVSSRRGEFRVVVPRGDSSLIEELRAMGVVVRFETTTPGLI